MTHRCHANGCEDEAHAEIPFCKRHFGILPEPHRKRMWAERPKGYCGACEAGMQHTSEDWKSLCNLGIAIIAAVEVPEYQPQPEWTDEAGFCWMAGIHDAEKSMKTANAVVKKFSISIGPAY